MYCHKCGIELGRDMQFCPACGSKVITEQSSEQSNLRQVQSSRISIPLLGKQVPFDATIKGYITIRKTFEELGEEICSDFTESFYSEYRDMDDLMRRLDADIGKFKKEGISQINSLLSELRVYGVPDKEMDDYLQCESRVKRGRKTAQKSRECKYVANKSHKALLCCLRQ